MLQRAAAMGNLHMQRRMRIKHAYVVKDIAVVFMRSVLSSLSFKLLDQDGPALELEILKLASASSNLYH